MQRFRLMLICCVDDEIELHLLERRHAPALEAMEPGDLSFSQGEWLFSRGGDAAYVEERLAQFGRGEALDAGIFRTRTLLGVVGLHDIDRGRARANLDYAMDGRYRAQGIMTRACCALLRYAYSELELNRIQIGADVANLPSRRIPEKLGFVLEGVVRASYRAESGFRDCALYAMLREDFIRLGA